VLAGVSFWLARQWADIRLFFANMFRLFHLSLVGAIHWSERAQPSPARRPARQPTRRA
jgi:hypothetical protein